MISVVTLYDYIPPVLFLQGDMTVYPLLEQEDKYMPILTGKEQPSTDYLAQFQDLHKFDDIFVSVCVALCL